MLRVSHSHAEQQPLGGGECPPPASRPGPTRTITPQTSNEEAMRFGNLPLPRSLCILPFTCTAASAPSMPGLLLHGPLLPFLPPPQGSCSASLSGGKDGRGTVKVEVVGATDISHCDHETRKERSPGEGSGDLCKAAFRAFSPLHDQITSTCQRRRINPEEASPSGGSLRCHSRGRKKNDFTPVCKCTH